MNRFSLALMGCLVVLGGCNSANPGPTANPGSPAAAAPSSVGASAAAGASADVCGLITANPALSGAIQQILGGQGTETPTGSAGLALCLVTNGSYLVDLSVDTRPDRAVALFDAVSSQPGVTALTGLGDAAFWTTNGLGNISVSVKKGTTVVGATVSKKIAGGFATPLDAAKSLALSLLASLGLA